MDWSRAQNPLIEFPDLSLKDACVVRADNGRIHCFTSAFDQERSTVIQLVSDDGIAWQRGPLHLTGTHLDAIGVCSPGITRHEDGNWVLHANTWGESDRADAQPTQPIYTVSPDLRQWSPCAPLAPKLIAGNTIDVTLAHHAGRWYANFKQGPLRMATADTLDGPWRYLGDGAPNGERCAGRLWLLRDEGADISAADGHHENGQLLCIDSVWHFLSTDFPPHEPWLYRMAGDPDDVESWTRFTDGRPLRVPSQDFNSFPADDSAAAAIAGIPALTPSPCHDDTARHRLKDGHANAAWIWDDRDRSSWFYLVYAGKNLTRASEFRGTAAANAWPRGWNRLGIARSRDLTNWEAAPDRALPGHACTCPT